MGSTLVIDGCAIATVDDKGTEHERGHIVIEGGRIAAVGSGEAPSVEGGRRIDASGMLATPGLVNCHHHLYQWLTRGLAQEANLFEWLVSLYPLWARIDADMEGTAASAGLAALMLSGCATTTDHHYVFPRGVPDLLEVEIAAARRVGIRFHPCRGSMDLGASEGGLPPDEVTENIDDILDATGAAIDRFHDPSYDSMLRIAVAPCSPFSVTPLLMREAAELARDKGVRLHTHLAETNDEEAFCLERFGMRPVDHVDELGWLEDDVWLAHCIHINDDEVKRFGVAGTGVAHCPSSNARLGAGIAPVAALLDAGAPVGLGVDGAASNEQGEISTEIRQALLLARLRDGSNALTARQALRLATVEGARCLGRAGEIGSLEVGKLADVALWRMEDAAHAGIADPVAALVLGPTRPVQTLIVNGRTVVGDSHLLTEDEDDIVRRTRDATRRLLDSTEVARL